MLYEHCNELSVPIKDGKLLDHNNYYQLLTDFALEVYSLLKLFVLYLIIFSVNIPISHIIKPYYPNTLSFSSIKSQTRSHAPHARSTQHRTLVRRLGHFT
jgi:hypothetical protein